MAETPNAQNRVPTAKRPRGRPFAPGNNANPGGRPKLDPDLAEFCKTKTLEYAQKLDLLACSANAEPDFVLRVFVEFRNTGWGKPVERRELSGNVAMTVVSSYAEPAEVVGHG